MPVWNQHEYLEEAVRSVEPQVSRLIVVDDGSDPPIPHADYRIEPNGGTAQAINRGLMLALAENPDWVTWVSSDNVMRSRWVEALLLASGPKVGVVYGGFTWAKGKNEKYLFVTHSKDRLIGQEDCYYGPAFLIRREVWQKAGPHRGKISHDYDHWLRVEEACWAMGMQIVGVDEDLCWYRAHDKRATVLRRHEYDAKHWQQEARKRRGIE